MRKVYNFSAGPAMLPEEVLLQAQAEMLDWQGTGMSIMELGHRGEEFQRLAAQTEADFRELMAIPDHYRILFLAGGASMQFAMVPLNLLVNNKKADYVATGIWSEKAILEAKRFGDIHVAARAHQRHDGLWYIPEQKEWKLRSEAAYLHYTPNETIAGLELPWIPDTGNVPLVADMTSMIMSRPIDVNRFGVIYAGAQKNLGQAGISVVIIREDLLHDTALSIPTLCSYKIHAENNSFYNTPPTYAWYLMGLVLAWQKKQGGLVKQADINQRKARKLYAIIDQYPDFYVNQIVPSNRSCMNVSFDLKRKHLIDLFLISANEAGLVNLKGHRLSGGIRASIYNAMPESGVDALADFMREFVKKYE